MIICTRCGRASDRAHTLTVSTPRRLVWRAILCVRCEDELETIVVKQADEWFATPPAEAAA